MPDQPTQADARDAMETLGPDTLEDTATPAVAYLQARLTEHGETPLWGRDTAMIVAAVALAVRAYIAQPVIARWDSSAVSDDATGETSVLCTTDTGQPVALVLDEEHAEALAGILLDTEDGEQPAPCACGTASITCACGDTRCPSCDPTCQQQSPTYRDGVRDALAAAAREAERTNPYAGPAALASAIRMMGTAGPLAQDGPVQVHADDLRDRVRIVVHPNVFPAKQADHVAEWIADDVMKEVAPVLAARDTRINELEERLTASEARSDRRWLAYQSARRGRAQATAGIDYLLQEAAHDTEGSTK